MAYTLDGIAYDSISFSPAETTVAEAVVSQNGEVLFVLSLSSDTIRQYTLTTPYDISTAVDTGKTFSTLAFNTNVTGLYLSPDGTKIYVYNYTNVRLHQINLATANDLTGASSPGYIFISSTIVSTPRRGLWFSPDGLYVFLASYLLSGTHVLRLSLSSAWDVSTVDVSTLYADNPYKIYFSGDAYATALMFTNNGSTMFVAFDGSDLIKEYSLSESYNPASATYAGINYDLSTICGTSLKGVSINETSGNLYAYGATQSFYQFTLGGESETPIVNITVTPFKVATMFSVNLTGDNDSLDDVVLPITNLNARVRSGSSSYLQVTVPYTEDYADAISDRPNGDIELTQIELYSDGDSDVWAVLDVALETVQTSISANSRSIVITGHRQSTNSSPSSHTRTAQSLQTGETITAIVPGYDHTILPADTLTVEGVEFVIDTVSIQASKAYILTQYIGVSA